MPAIDVTTPLWARLLVSGVVVLCVHGCAAGSADSAGADDDDGPMVMLIPRDVQEIDPRFSGDAYGHKLSRLLFASLVTIDSDSLEVIPDLAEQVAIVSPTLYRASLRSGLRFADGSVLDATDVAATYRSVVDPAMRSRYARTYERIARIEILDARTIDFHLNGPHATFMTDLELPVMRAEDERKHVGQLGAAMPVGAGPYRLLSRSEGRIELGPNRHWYGGTPRFPRVRMLVVHDDNTRALRLLAGAADLALNAIPPLLLPLFEADPRFRVRSAPGVGTAYVGLNMEAPALRDVRVRRALAHGIDRVRLMHSKLGKRARLARGWIVPGHWAWDEATPEHAYDPDKARGLLRQAAGPAPGETAWPPRVHLTLRCGSDRSRQSIARALAAMWAEIGVDVEVRPSEQATLLADLNRGRFELTMLDVPEVIEPHVLSFFFGSDHVPGSGREGSNRWRLRSAALDRALESGRAQVDRDARKAAYREVQAILAEELPVIPLWHEDVVAVESQRALGFQVPRLGRFDPLARQVDPTRSR
jgi:peptide/nickel transport system substrate-binding protein